MQNSVFRINIARCTMCRHNDVENWAIVSRRALTFGGKYSGCALIRYLVINFSLILQKLQNMRLQECPTRFYLVLSAHKCFVYIIGHCIFLRYLPKIFRIYMSRTWNSKKNVPRLFLFINATFRDIAILFSNFIMTKLCVIVQIL